MSESKADSEKYYASAYPDYSNQYIFSSGNAPLGSSTAILNGDGNCGSEAQLTSMPLFASYFLEKILSYSYLREKFRHRISVSPFSQYIIHFSGTPGRYFVFVLREIII
ncbi:MAG: hypothetical protein ABFC28_03595 [Rikenellaceae bacterium]